MNDAPKPLRLLLVEDDDGQARLIRIGLAECGAVGPAARAKTLAEAKEILNREPFDAVLLDLGLPDSVGLETIKGVRDAKADLPIVVLTGNDDEEFALHAVEDGVQDFLHKNDTDGKAILKAARYAVARSGLERRLAESEQRLHGILSLARDPIVAAGKNKRVVLFNPAAEKMLGWTAAEAFGRPMDEILRLCAPSMEESRRRMAGRSDGIHLEADAIRRDGTRVPVDVTRSEEGDPRDEGFLCIAVLRDASERRRDEAELKRMAETDPLCRGHLKTPRSGHMKNPHPDAA